MQQAGQKAALDCGQAGIRGRRGRFRGRGDRRFGLRKLLHNQPVLGCQRNRADAVKFREVDFNFRRHVFTFGFQQFVDCGCDQGMVQFGQSFGFQGGFEPILFAHQEINIFQQRRGALDLAPVAQKPFAAPVAAEAPVAVEIVEGIDRIAVFPGVAEDGGGEHAIRGAMELAEQFFADASLSVPVVTIGQCGADVADDGFHIVGMELEKSGFGQFVRGHGVKRREQFVRAVRLRILQNQNLPVGPYLGEIVQQRTVQLIVDDVILQPQSAVPVDSRIDFPVTQPEIPEGPEALGGGRHPDLIDQFVEIDECEGE
ncbi:hypothetical protein SDC9_122709 [bioreactor metagenome]|uniref:Uncharacterized protein n=1 Tax=bioreactor metagenome TaxID=1076179 RepID=A0A645CFP3_9ZZZZ